jgi:hypothetical protein
MKKSILSATFLILGTLGVLAQGAVFDFSNAPWEAWPEATPPDRLVYYKNSPTDTAKPISDDTWSAAVYELVGGQYVKLGDNEKFFGAGLEGIFANDGVQRAVSVNPGVATTLQIRIFDGAGALLGSSPDFQYTMASSVPPSPTDVLLVNLRAFTVTVPEPSTIALGVLGLGALLLFRRRK